jgi:hypothetical protein
MVPIETESGQVVQAHVRGMQYIKEHVDTSKVHTKDLNYIDDILYGILEFEDPMPMLTMSVKNNPGQYVIVVEGYNKPFLVSEWYAYFDNADTRSPKFRHIQSTRINPKLGNVEIIVTRVSDDRRPSAAAASTAAARRSAAATPYRRPAGMAPKRVYREATAFDEDDMQ